MVSGILEPQLNIKTTLPDIATLLSSSIATSNLGSAPLFYGEFSMPSGNDDDFLYLIWDYRDS